MHSLGEALRGYLQDLPSPVVPVSVHGDILRVLQGKGLPGHAWERGGGWDGCVWVVKTGPVPVGYVARPLRLTALPHRGCQRVERGAGCPSPFHRAWFLSPEVPQPENCRKQLLLALESPAVPLQNTLTLQFLLRHLGKVSQQAESNNLHPRALGEIFGPLLLRLPGARYMRLSGPCHVPRAGRLACQDEEPRL